eukprot:gene5764-6004_t
MHGTLTGATAGGNYGITNTLVPALTMSGAAPKAHLSVYKVCWGPTDDSACFVSNLVAGIDAAAGDGVDVINYSLGAYAEPIFSTPVETAFRHAAAAGIFVAAACGNDGPDLSTMYDTWGPWIMSVGASTHNRRSVAVAALGNGENYTGEGVAKVSAGPAPLVLSDSVALPGTDLTEVQLCYPNTLSADKCLGKIVVCDRGVVSRVAKSAEVARAGGLAGTATLTRTVTSVLDITAQWTVNISAPAGFAVTVSPQSFSLDPGARQSLLVGLTRQPGTPYNEWRDGAIIWASGTGIKARIPVVLKAAELAVSPPMIRISNRTAAYTFNVIPDWTGSLVTVPVGMQAARVLQGTVSNSVANGATNVTITCPPASGATHLRIRLYNNDMPPTPAGQQAYDLNLVVYARGEEAARSNNFEQSNEEVNIENAAGTTYTVQVVGQSIPGGSVGFKVHWWLLNFRGPASSNFNSSPNARKPAAVAAGQPIPVTLTFNARLLRPANGRFLGAVVYGRGAAAGTTPLETVTLVELE